MTPNQVRGEIGEHLLTQILYSQGAHVFVDWNKHVSGSGIDRIALTKSGELWLLDNKAQSRGIGHADALTGPQFEASVKRVRTFLETQTEKEAIAAINALDAGR